MTIHVRLAGAAALAAVACGPGGPMTEPAPITALPRALTAAEQRLIAADNAFALRLLGQVIVERRDAPGNVFLSPLSVAMALAMTYNGAAGATEEAMRATLGLHGMTVSEVNQGYRELIALLRALDPRVRFALANSIWYRQDFAVEQSFLDATRTHYDARVAALDFRSPTAAQTINAWVSEATQGRITDIVEPVLPEWAMLYLINAIYFQGDWTQQFDRRLTAPRPFRLADGSTVTAPTMTHGREVNIRVYRDATAEVLELPYGGRAFTMTVVMPPQPDGLDGLLAGLTAERWDGWIAGLDSASSQVYLPKYILTDDLLLNPTLDALGMGIAFDCDAPEMADFTRMHRPQEVCITRVKHKTYVDVNEEGTEAAAVTAVEVGVTSAPPTIEVDRPFLFAIRETLSGTILFIGVIRNPVAS
jgi:serpin B